MAKSIFTGPSIAELDAIELADYGHLNKKPDGGAHIDSGLRTPEEAHAPSHFNEYTPKTPSELELSEPSTPRQTTATGVFPSFFFPAMNKWRVCASCLIYFGNGMSDSAPGA